MTTRLLLHDPVDRCSTSPSLAPWINTTFPGLTAHSLRSLDLLKANDFEIFQKAKAANTVIVSKDSDFLKLILEHGTPPSLIWITCGNTSNAKMRDVLGKTLEDAIKLIKKGEGVVEISDLS